MRRLDSVPAAVRGAVLAAALAVLWAGPALGQDVVLLGEIYGTRPPEGYYRQLEADPESFRFSSEGIERLERLREGLYGSVPPAPPGSARALGPRAEPIVGAFRFPLVLGLFSDGPAPPFSRVEVQRELIDGPNSYFQTIPEFYAELSGGLVQLEGTTFDWVQSGLTRAQVTQNQSALVSHRTEGIGAFVEAVVRSADATGLDWSVYDADRDGFVDLLTVIHPVPGAECAGGGTNQIWSHRWSLERATEGRLDPGLPTSTPRPAGPGVIYVNDYTVQPVLACDGESFNQIGTFAHELGHGFGLPDLYPTGDQSHRGSGNWDLMGTGSWGCRGTDPSRPCHMGAWSKAALGWVEVEEIKPGTDEVVTLPPVESSRRALRIPSQDGSGEYILLENRQPLGSDVHLPEPGLLVWHVAPAVLDARWASNNVNAEASRLGVWLRQADGRNHLALPGGNRGDRGDPFPGCIKEDYFDPEEACEVNREFHAGNPPFSRTHVGSAMGITLTEIEAVGPAPGDVRFRAHTGFTTVSLAAEWEEAPLAPPRFHVDGAEGEGGETTFVAAPFEVHEISAPPGIPLGPGTRAPFQAWSDGGPRTRLFVTPLQDAELVARYAGREVQIGVTVTAPVAGISPGSVVSVPASEGFWFAEGTEVFLEATPRTGFSFLEWMGAVAGSLNPATLTVGTAVDVEARFDVTYALAETAERVSLEAATPGEIAFQVLNANVPVTWTLEEGTLPDGLILDGASGRILGGAMETGAFPLQILAQDAIGLEARGTIVLDVGPPRLGASTLVGPFIESGVGPTPLQQWFLDRWGNASGAYDIGDFRAFLLAHPELPESVPEAQLVRTLVPLGPLEPAEDDDG